MDQKVVICKFQHLASKLFELYSVGQQNISFFGYGHFLLHLVFNGILDFLRDLRSCVAFRLSGFSEGIIFFFCGLYGCVLLYGFYSLAGFVINNDFLMAVEVEFRVELRLFGEQLF